MLGKETSSLLTGIVNTHKMVVEYTGEVMSRSITEVINFIALYMKRAILGHTCRYYSYCA